MKEFLVMIQTIDLKKGMVFERGGKLLRVLQINHHKPGKGNTLMQMDIQDVRTGSIVHTTMRPSEKVEQVNVDKRQAQYLYDQGDASVFMDMENYDQYEVSASQLGDDKKYLVENMKVTVNFVDGEIVGIELPTTVELEVADTQPMIKGATIDGGGKPATMTTGLVVNVPAFIKNGDKLIINTTDGSYKSRA
ncbi:translation elongation factor P [Limosilactobacillus vaginalis DSM 5837 = ATCC 49540]|mgnify:CR=1 FL=1|uniref:Elongation factor P n=3 Tax=Limosilactobacillus TaxID=2742598 RepID=C2EV17_9LACO|nr:translation elongation factor P [Limosilactobacillus vaginalis DSM 5837 = ATCC 49540]